MTSTTKPPHLVQYQGSKRNTASQIVSHFPTIHGRFIEPFCGTCALSLHLAHNGFMGDFLLNDINKPLVDLMESCVNDPEHLADEYQQIYDQQFSTDPVSYFAQQRDCFNAAPFPALTLFILGRIVKGSLRYSTSGIMNQSCDKRRTSPHPDTIRKRCCRISELLKGRTQFSCVDYKEILQSARKGDFVYMDPPYQGTSVGKDKRYASGIDFDEFVEELRKLNKRGISYAVSYDGKCGDIRYGKELPIKELGLEVYEVDGGRSTQATLLGRNERTMERLYVRVGA